MSSNLKALFKKRNRDLRKRIYFTLFALTVFKVGTTISVPGTNAITGLGFLELLNAMGGGALERFSIFALGVMPYITASIMIQLLQKDIVPYFTELSKQGEVGRRKLSVITRYVGIFFALVQGFMFSFAFLGEGAQLLDQIRVTLILTTGTAFLLWLGDQITQKGIGNGISMIIMAGIISTLPSMLTTAYGSLVTDGNLQTEFLGWVKMIMFVITYLAIIVGVVFVQKAERRIPIQYSNKTSSSYSSKQTYMPFKINSASVIPVIFASALMSFPGTISYFVKSEDFQLFIGKYLMYDTAVGFIIYISLILFFSYFYTFLMIRPKELSENLQKNAGYIPGIRPGQETTLYVTQVLSRLTIIGAIFLATIAGLPIIFNKVSNLPTNIVIGGTGLLIVVGVALETYNQLESTLVSRNYQGGTRRRKNR